MAWFFYDVSKTLSAMNSYFERFLFFIILRAKVIFKYSDIDKTKP